MKIERKYLYAAGAALAAAVLISLLFRGCSDKEKITEMGPGETTEAFCRAAASGDIDAARSLCDTVRMHTYIESWRSSLEKAAIKDSIVADIACGIMENMTFSVSEIRKNGQERVVFYRIGLSEDNMKDKVATLVKEGERWKITAITDRH